MLPRYKKWEPFFVGQSVKTYKGLEGKITAVPGGKNRFVASGHVWVMIKVFGREISVVADDLTPL